MAGDILVEGRKRELRGEGRTGSDDGYGNAGEITGRVGRGGRGVRYLARYKRKKARRKKCGVGE